jgi:hypothetical protein
MTRTNKDIVIGLWKSFSARDETQMRDNLAEQAVWIAPGDNATANFLSVPSGMNGRDQIVRFIVDRGLSPSRGPYASRRRIKDKLILEATSRGP